MRYCHHCKHLNTGRPRYCQYCAHTFNVKICSRGHINSINNLVCGECGSQDLSEPALLPQGLSITKQLFKILFLIFCTAIFFQYGLLIIQTLLMLVFLFISLFIFINILNELLPSPFNKIVPAIWKAIKVLIGRGNDNKSGTK